MSINYRPDIDGLRALAVLSVIFFNFEIVVFEKILFPGGFLGVDIFFVISGYLITSIIFKQIKHTGNFNFLFFYDYGHFSIEGAKYFGKKMYNLGWFK